MTPAARMGYLIGYMAQSLIEITRAPDLEDAKAQAYVALGQVRREDDGILPPSVRRKIKTEV